MQSILEKAKEGIDMNLLAFRSPDRIYYSNSCPAGLGGYSNQGHAWQLKGGPAQKMAIFSNGL
jgi:hypothetical protein